MLYSPREKGMPYTSGQHKVCCQRCGFNIESSEARTEPKTNLIVCDKCFDPRHPLDRPIHGLGEKQAVTSLHSPEYLRAISPTFLTPGEVTPASLTSNTPEGIPTPDSTFENSGAVEFLSPGDVTPEDL
jgi:hypothetical protein